VVSPDAALIDLTVKDIEAITNLGVDARIETHIRSLYLRGNAFGLII
jgi:hypothetical protein